MAKNRTLTVRLNDYQLDFIDEFRKEISSDEEYVSKSEAVREIIVHMALEITLMSSSLHNWLDRLVVPEEKVAEVLRDHNYLVADKEDGISEVVDFLEDRGYEVKNGD